MTRAGARPPAWLEACGFDSPLRLPTTSTSLARPLGAQPPPELELDAQSALSRPSRRPLPAPSWPRGRRSAARERCRRRRLDAVPPWPRCHRNYHRHRPLHGPPRRLPIGALIGCPYPTGAPVATRAQLRDANATTAAAATYHQPCAHAHSRLTCHVLCVRRVRSHRLVVSEARR